MNEKFKFRTGTTVIDFRGGDRLSSKNRDLTVPAQVVLMDPGGRLFIQDELDDTESVTEYQDAMEGGQDGRGRGGYGEDMLEGSGYGGER